MILILIKKELKKSLKKIQSKFIKTTVLNETVIDNLPYRVVDKTSFLPWYKNRRALCFKNPDEPHRIYVHSMIYHSKRSHYQPTLIIPQKVIEAWHNVYKVKNALMLGAAGCTVPRFIALNFPEMTTVGIEYCPEFIELANKYFFISEISDRFSLVQGDAYDYVKNPNVSSKSDVVFVDIFSEYSIPNETFSDEFINALYEITSSDAVIIFNLLSLNQDDAVVFAKGIKASFSRKTVICKNERVTLVLVKSTDSEKSKRFSDRLHTLGDITEII